MKRPVGMKQDANRPAETCLWRWTVEWSTYLQVRVTTWVDKKVTGVRLQSKTKHIWPNETEQYADSFYDEKTCWHQPGSRHTSAHVPLEMDCTMVQQRPVQRLPKEQRSTTQYTKQQKTCLERKNTCGWKCQRVVGRSKTRMLANSCNLQTPALGERERSSRNVTVSGTRGCASTGQCTRYGSSTSHSPNLEASQEHRLGRLRTPPHRRDKATIEGSMSSQAWGDACTPVVPEPAASAWQTHNQATSHHNTKRLTFLRTGKNKVTQGTENWSAIHLLGQNGSRQPHTASTVHADGLTPEPGVRACDTQRKDGTRGDPDRSLKTLHQDDVSSIQNTPSETLQGHQANQDSPRGLQKPIRERWCTNLSVNNMGPPDKHACRTSIEPPRTPGPGNRDAEACGRLVSACRESNSTHHSETEEVVSTKMSASVPKQKQ